MPNKRKKPKIINLTNRTRRHLLRSLILRETVQGCGRVRNWTRVKRRSLVKWDNDNTLKVQTGLLSRCRETYIAAYGTNVMKSLFIQQTECGNWMLVIFSNTMLVLIHQRLWWICDDQSIMLRLNIFCKTQTYMWLIRISSRKFLSIEVQRMFSLKQGELAKLLQIGVLRFCYKLVKVHE